MNNEFKLRDYQEEAVKKISKVRNNSKSVVVMATGLGKSFTMANIPHKGKMLILSHRDELVHQPTKYFKEAVGFEQGKESANDEMVVSASVQSLSKDKRLEKFKKDEFEYIIIDECHHAVAPTYTKILEYFENYKLIGFTATPKRGDSAGLNAVFDNIIYSKDIAWGIKNGYLCNLIGTVIDVDIDISDIKFQMGDYAIKELITRIDNPKVYNAIAYAYQKYVCNQNHHALIYCIDVKSCNETLKYIEELMPEEKGKVKIITGETPIEERREYEEGYLKGDIHALINCMVLTEGVDLPCTDVIIVARPSANETLYTQIVGRGTRLDKTHKKEQCLILDILPRKTRKVCSIETLAGNIYNPEEKEKGQRSLIDMINQKEEKAVITTDRLKFIEKEFSLLEEDIKNREEMMNSCKDKGVKIYAETIMDTFKKSSEKAMEEDGEFDCHNVCYSLGNTDEQRYIIKAGQGESIVFYISKPDILNKSTLKGQILGEDVSIDEPMDISEMFKLINRYFTLTDVPLFYWNNTYRERWQSEEASEKQSFIIKKMASVYGFKEDRASLSKSEASMLIETFQNYGRVLDKAHMFQKDMSIIETIKEKEKELRTFNTDIDLMSKKERKEAESKIESISLSIEKSKQKLKNDVVIKQDEKDFVRLVELKVIENGERLKQEEAMIPSSITVEMPIFLKRDKTPPTDGQVEFAKSLLNYAKSREIDLGANFTADKLYKFEASLLISLLNTVKKEYPFMKKVNFDVNEIKRYLYENENGRFFRFTISRTTS